MRAAGSAIVLVWVTVAAQAAAQSGSPARQTQDMFDVRNKESDYFEHTFRAQPRVAADSYARALQLAICVAKLDGAVLNSVVATDAGSNEEARAIRTMTSRYRNCAATRESVPPLLVRGAIAEVLWKQGGANPNPLDRKSVDIADVESFIKASPRGEAGVKTAGMPLYWVSRCQVMALPNKTAEILAAEPGSAEEKAQAETLYASSHVCGVQKGLDQTPVQAVRAALADALYQDGRRTVKAAN
jgi:hypothetical protein